MPLSLQERFLQGLPNASQEEAELFYARFKDYIQFVYCPPSESFRIDTRDVYTFLGCTAPEELNALVDIHLEKGKHYKLVYRGARTRLTPLGLMELCDRLDTHRAHRVKWYFQKLIHAVREHTMEVLGA